MIDSLIIKDIELLIYLNNLGTEQWDGFWVFITNKYSSIPLYLFLIYASYRYFGVKKTIAIIVSALLVITLSDQTSQFFKYHFMRIRPCSDEAIIPHIRMVLDRCSGGYSYFSAHAANSMGIAGFFSLVLRRKLPMLQLILIFWAITVAYSRIYLAVHFPADVFTGLFFGGTYAVILYSLYKKVAVKFLD